MAENNTATSPNTNMRRTWIITALVAVGIATVAAVFIYWRITSERVSVDTASIEAPEIDLAPSAPGILEAVYVNEGDMVPADTTVARVGNELIQTKVAGIILTVPQTIGAQETPGTPVVTMIDPTQLRVVGKVAEDKGL